MRQTRNFVIAAAALAFLAGGLELLLPPDSPTFTQGLAASDDDYACEGIMPPGDGVSPALNGSIGGDIVPVRSVQDPYPSLHSVAVDPENNKVVMSDSNRGSLLFYTRTSGSDSTGVTQPEYQVRGPATGMMFIAGVAVDPVNREVYTVDNDIGDRMMVLPYDAQGNVKPKRVLFVPHGSWGISLNRARDEIAIAVEHVNSVVVYRREAQGGEAPLRVIRGPKTGLADPHGVVFDSDHNEIIVTNHGNRAPLTKPASADAAPEGGSFDRPSIRTFPGLAEGNAEPGRTIQGAQTELNWPMGISLDTVHNEIAVASYGNNSILIFRRTDHGDAVPARIIRGNRTGIAGPMGVAIDAKNDELWVTNYGDHSGVVFSRTAEGNARPKRIIRNAPRGTPAVGFGNPGAVAYDPKRDEILVPN